MKIQSTIKRKQEELDAEEKLSRERNGLISRGLLMSYASYIDAEAAEPYLKNKGYGEYKRVSTWFGAEAFFCINDRRATIAFAGTNSVIDIFVDVLGIIPWRWPLFHSGFAGSWRALKHKKIDAWLQKHEKDFDDISLYGHSLGGAIANVAAFDLVTRYSIREVVTFGAPRSAFLSSANKYDEAVVIGSELTLKEVTHRVVHGFDLVSKVPFAFMGYTHVGELVYQDYEGNTDFGEVAQENKRAESIFRIGSKWYRSQKKNLLNSTEGFSMEPPLSPGIPNNNMQAKLYNSGTLYNRGSNLSVFDRLESLIKVTGNIFPTIKSHVILIVACFIPLVVFIAMVSYFIVGGKSHSLKGYFRKGGFGSFTYRRLKTELYESKPQGIVRLTLYNIKARLMSTFVVILKVAVTGGVIFCAARIIQFTLIPIVKEIFAVF